MLTGTTTVQELLDDAITYDMPYMAHLIYYMLLSKKISLLDDSKKIKEIDLSKEEYKEFYRLYQADALTVRPIKLFAVQVSRREFAFYFAKTASEVQLLHQKLYKVLAQKIINAHEKMIWHELFFPETGQYKTFKTLLTETIEFPKLVCVLESR